MESYDAASLKKQNVPELKKILKKHKIDRCPPYSKLKKAELINLITINVKKKIGHLLGGPKVEPEKKAPEKKAPVKKAPVKKAPEKKAPKKEPPKKEPEKSENLTGLDAAIKYLKSLNVEALAAEQGLEAGYEAELIEGIKKYHKYVESLSKRPEPKTGQAQKARNEKRNEMFNKTFMHGILSTLQGKKLQTMIEKKQEKEPAKKEPAKVAPKKSVEKTGPTYRMGDKKLGTALAYIRSLKLPADEERAAINEAKDMYYKEEKKVKNLFL